VLFGAGTLCGLTDGQLLSRFTNGAPESAHAAFSALVDRHGGMVLGVCRDILENADDAHDAFQATFLVLARRAKTVRRPESVGCWLHGVAQRISARARVDAARRRAYERRKGELCAQQSIDADRREVDTSLHEEIQRLPEKYRAPIVLCYLESLTHDAAAAHLGWPVGTVRGRLARARDLLRTRLTRRGLAVAVGAAAATTITAEAAVPAALREATVNAAVSFATAGKPALVPLVATRVQTWIAAELGSPAVVTLKLALPTLLLAGVLAAGAGLATRAVSDESAKTDPARPKPDSQPNPATPRDDRTAIQGNWVTSQPLTSTRAGQPLPPKDVPVVWKIEGDRIVETVGSPTDEDGVRELLQRFVLNPAATPRTIDLTSSAYGLIKGIYRLEGDTLTVCYGFGERPASFGRGGESGLVHMVFKRAKESAQRAASRFPNADACEWALFPTRISGASSMSAATRGGFVLSIDREAGLPLSVSLAHPGRQTDAPAPEYVAVAFDAAAKRYPLTAISRAEGGDARLGSTVALRQFKLDPKVLPAEKATHLGIEVITPESRKRASQAGQAKAREAGVAVLPTPLIGKPFDFTLTTVEGKPIRSRDLRGKVILIDCWATWCAPCMAKMPALKDLYSRRRGDGLEIIGIGFDEKPEAASKAVRSLGLAWPQVLVPADEDVRALWKEAAQVDGLPRLFLVDRQGILRWAGDVGDLTASVVRLLDEPSRP
jgi:RNA polymerase sigma factor (sigma-70 family)